MQYNIGDLDHCDALLRGIDSMESSSLAMATVGGWLTGEQGVIIQLQL